LTPFQSEDRLAQQIAVGMQKRWPEMLGYSRAHDPGSNRTPPWRGRRQSGRQQACRRGKPDRERRCIKMQWIPTRLRALPSTDHDL